MGLWLGTQATLKVALQAESVIEYFQNSPLYVWVLEVKYDASPRAGGNILVLILIL